MRSVIKPLGIGLVALLTVIPLGFPTAQGSGIIWKTDSNGKLIPPKGYKIMTDQEYIEWFCKTYPDKCDEIPYKSRTSDDDFNPGGGC